MEGVDWHVLRVQYELFGETVESLSESYGVSPSMLEYAIEEEGWSRTKVSRTAQDWTGIEQLNDLGEDIKAEVDARMDVVRLLKNQALNPRYVALETAILGKGLEVIRAIAAESPTAAVQLKAVTDVLNTLKEKSGMSPAKGEEQNKGTTIKVNVLGHVGNDGGAQLGTQVVIDQPQLKAIDCSPGDVADG